MRIFKILSQVVQLIASCCIGQLDISRVGENIPRRGVNGYMANIMTNDAELKLIETH